MYIHPRDRVISLTLSLSLSFSLGCFTFPVRSSVKYHDESSITPGDSTFAKSRRTKRGEEKGWRVCRESERRLVFSFPAVLQNSLRASRRAERLNRFSRTPVAIKTDTKVASNSVEIYPRRTRVIWPRWANLVSKRRANIPRL